MAYTATHERTLPATWTKEKMGEKLTEVERDGLLDGDHRIPVDLIALRAGKIEGSEEVANLAEFGTPSEAENETIEIFDDVPAPGADDAGDDQVVGFFSKLQKQGYGVICYSNLHFAPADGAQSVKREAVTCRKNPKNEAPNPEDVVPVPAGNISQAALDLIAESEGFDQPGRWPGAASGVTIGMGYDLGYNTAERFRQDWQRYLPGDLIKRLASAIGLKGSAARAKSQEFRGITIPRDPAVAVFKESTVPRFLKMTLDAFPGADRLPPDALGALVSLVFNRGPAINGPRRREMAEIKRIVQSGASMRFILNEVARQIRSMKRLWEGRGLRGLLVRREKEARLVENANSPLGENEIRAHQQKLKDAGFDPGPIDGRWGRRTEDATRRWQASTGQKLPSDTGRNVITPDHATAKASDALHSALSSEERERTFGGPFDWVHRPANDNPENIEIRGGWEADNIVSVDLPELAEATRGEFRGMQWNKRARKQLEDLWKAWKAAGLLPLIKTYEGAFVPRLVRGSTKSISNHAYGTAFDINYEWNQLGKTPARPGTNGSVWELVPLAHEHGFFWGGFFSRGDGMHFEVCKILSGESATAEIPSGNQQNTETNQAKEQQN